jgi:hypothetical protein
VGDAYSCGLRSTGEKRRASCGIFYLKVKDKQLPNHSSVFAECFLPLCVAVYSKNCEEDEQIEILLFHCIDDFAAMIYQTKRRAHVSLSPCERDT